MWCRWGSECAGIGAERRAAVVVAEFDLALSGVAERGQVVESQGIAAEIGKDISAGTDAGRYPSADAV